MLTAPFSLNLPANFVCELDRVSPRELPNVVTTVLRQYQAGGGRHLGHAVWSSLHANRGVLGSSRIRNGDKTEVSAERRLADGVVSEILPPLVWAVVRWTTAR